MTKKTKTVLIILISLFLIAGIGVAVLATTDLGKGTIFKKDVVEETDEIENHDDDNNSSTVKYDMSSSDYLIELIKNHKTISLEESGDDEDTYAANSFIIAYVDENGNFYNKYGFGISFTDDVIPFYMTPEDLETQEAREATFERLLSLIPEGFDLHGNTPEEAVRNVMQHNLVAYNIDEIVDNCPWGYFIWDPYILNDDLTINMEDTYGMIYESNVNIEPWCTYTPQGHVITTVNDTETYHEVYNDMSQASGWTLEAFNTACEWVEAKNNGRFEVTKTATYFKASDEHGCFTEIDFNNKYIKNHEVYYTTQEMIDRFYKESDVRTPEEYRKQAGIPTNCIY